MVEHILISLVVLSALAALFSTLAE